MVRKRNRERYLPVTAAQNENCGDVEDESSGDLENKAPEFDSSTDSSVQAKSNVWNYAHRTSNSHDWAICDLCPSSPSPKRISVKGGATTTLRKHLINRHHKTELVLTQHTSQNEKLSIVNQKRLHELLINAIIIDGRSFGDFRKLGFQRFLEFVTPGNSILLSLQIDNVFCRLSWTSSKHSSLFLEEFVQRTPRETL